MESILHNHEFRKTNVQISSHSKQNKMYVLHSCRSLNLYLSLRIRAFTPPTTPQNNMVHKLNSKALFRKNKTKQNKTKNKEQKTRNKNKKQKNKKQTNKKQSKTKTKNKKQKTR